MEQREERLNRRQTESHQVYLNGRGAKEEGEAKEEVDEVKTKDEIQPSSYTLSYTRNDL